VTRYEYLRSDRHVYRCVAGEHLLIALHRESDEPMFALTVSAAEIWSGMESWTTIADLVQRITDRFAITPERAEADVREFLEQLASIGAVHQREL
jgi:uncharacterized protein (DUF2461 family)